MINKVLVSPNHELIRNNPQMENNYKEMIQEWLETGEKMVPFVLKYDTSDFNNLILNLENDSKGINIVETFVPHTTFWLLDDDLKILGVSNLRHKLNDKLLISGGHIGYGIRPSERNKGYGSLILRLTLMEAKKMGLERVFITADKENTNSIKVIRNNNGQFDSEIMFEDTLIQRFWISL